MKHHLICTERSKRVCIFATTKKETPCSTLNAAYFHRQKKHPYPIAKMFHVVREKHQTYIPVTLTLKHDLVSYLRRLFVINNK